MMDILVVGDYPSAKETRSGQVMTGDAVRILKESMEKVGLPVSEEKVKYTVAIFKALPKRSSYTVPKEILKEYHQQLLDQIEEAKADIVLLLGKIPYMVLTLDFSVKITTEYGKARKYPTCGDSLIIPIMHPGVLRHAPAKYKPFLQELQFISGIYNKKKQYNPGTTNWEVLETEQDCDEACNFLKSYKDVAADIETTGLDYRFAEFCVMGIAYDKNKVFVLPRKFRHRVKDFFSIKNIDWCWHNGMYDHKILWRRGLLDNDNFPHQNDTIYMHYLLDETSEHNLGYLTKVFLCAEDYKYKMNQEFKNVTLETYDKYYEALCERVAVDADYTLQLSRVLGSKLQLPENGSLLKCYKQLIMPAAPFLNHVEENGLLIDKNVLQKFGEKYVAQLDEILSEVEDLAEPYWKPEDYMEDTGAKSAPEKFNPGSPKQVAWLVFDKMRLHARRKQGRSTGVEVLSSIEEDVPLIKKILEYRGVKKEYSTYVLGLLSKCDTDNRVHAHFSLNTTATGRLSCKEPNIQNLPAAHGVGNIRSAIIPPKGKILMEVDYSGAELRWLAFLSGCPVLREVYMENRNLHKETATALFGPNFTPQQKMRAKAVNFGIVYGRQANSFKDEFHITIEEAQGMINGWLSKYHGARDYLQWCADQILLGKYLQTPWGNRRRFGLVTKESLGSLQNEAKNFPIQGASSHTLLYANMKIEKELREKYDTRQINLIHDSCLLEVPMDKDTVQAVSKFVSGYMINVPKELFDCPIPFACDTDLGPDWGHVEAYNNETGMMELDEGNVSYEEWIKKVYHS